jgi:hypothetical protein
MRPGPKNPNHRGGHGKKGVVAYDYVTGKRLAEFKSVADAAWLFQVARSTIREHCAGNSKHGPSRFFWPEDGRRIRLAWDR